ncbi:MAG TPA: helix-turn-helix transcriptional regulator [Allosphingosinicella sp.]|nr:helix-turn-helix transcriptional regulator [Allosphingosinicella sp.]
MDSRAAANLSEGQRECLRMVLRHMSSKEIARALGISRHTVDQRLRLAMKTLGAASRVDAARAFAAHEGAEAYQPSVHQSLRLDPAPAADPPVASRTREADDDGGLRRLGWIMGIAAATAVFLGALFIALNALSELTK